MMITWWSFSFYELEWVIRLPLGAHLHS
uniref:Uncharacterized protein n=1 Tax=Arundo donax TaxID=35708 RepID=A0A0A8Y101_ARUDO